MKLTPEGLARSLRNNGYLVPVRVLETAMQRGMVQSGECAAGRKEALEEALREIADGYGPNHLSKFARDKARAALAKPDQP